MNDGKGGKELRIGESTSSDLGISEGGGIEGNVAAFRYSLPNGLSRAATCILRLNITNFTVIDVRTNHCSKFAKYIRAEVR